MKIIKSNEAAKTNGIKMLIYGQSGAGKTYLIRTLPDLEHTLLLSAESGLKSISDLSVDTVIIQSIEDMQNAYLELKTDNFYTCVFLDSLSEIAEQILFFEKKVVKDGRSAHTNMQERIVSLTKAFRDMQKNVVMTAKLDRIQDEFSVIHYGPGFPGKQSAIQLPYLFDSVFALRKRDTEEGVKRALQTDSDMIWFAKHRGNELNLFEQPDLSIIFKKIKGVE